MQSSQDLLNITQIPRDVLRLLLHSTKFHCYTSLASQPPHQATTKLIPGHRLIKTR